MTQKALVDIAAVTKIARLARLEIPEADKQGISNEISGILQWIDQLNEVNTDNVPMLTSVSAVKLPFRKDEVTDGGQAEAVVANAPNSDYGCFVVPKVME